jgi:hypothetical protein
VSERREGIKGAIRLQLYSKKIKRSRSLARSKRSSTENKRSMLSTRLVLLTILLAIAAGVRGKNRHLYQITH